MTQLTNELIEQIKTWSPERRACMAQSMDDTFHAVTGTPRAADRCGSDQDKPGIWFLSAFFTAAVCCERDVTPGQEIRDDGTGQYEHRECVRGE
jgi:hypothetical protein